MGFVEASIIKSAGRLMKIEIQADKSEVLGGPELIPYLKLELSEDGNAILCADHRHFSQHMVPIEEWSGRTRVWSATLSPGSYAIADPVAIEALAERLKPLLARVAAGHTVQWGGRTMSAASEMMPAKPVLKSKGFSRPRDGGIISAKFGTQMIGCSSADMLASPRTVASVLLRMKPRIRLRVKRSKQTPVSTDSSL